MQTLLAHEWLAPIGGSENVFEQLMEIFPDSRNVCMWNDAPERFPSGIEETRLAALPLRRSKSLALPFMSSAWRSVDLAGVDRVIASSHAFAHHLAARAAEQGIPAFSYVYTPARYVWAAEFDHRGQSPLAKAGRRHFQRVDRAATSPKVSYAADSEFVRERIERAWGHPAAVIYPPVDIAEIQGTSDWRERVTDEAELKRLAALPDTFVLGASRLVEYKRLDTAIDVGAALDLPVVIAGSGPDEARLHDLASRSSVPVTFFGHASTPALYSLYQAASLFVFMAVEDFGIMPVEAMAVGTPVLVNATGGAMESVDYLGGGAASDPTSPDLATAAMAAMHTDMASAVLRSDHFSREHFSDRILQWVGG